MKGLKLPDAPANQTDPVSAWMEPVVIPTYHPLPPDKNPMFLEKRVYQGSSGRVYPLPFTDRISMDAVEHTWQAGGRRVVFLRTARCSSSPGKIMLVVLALQNLSGDGRQEYLADGITEEIITQLGDLDPQHLE